MNVASRFANGFAHITREKESPASAPTTTAAIATSTTTAATPSAAGPTAPTKFKSFVTWKDSDWDEPMKGLVRRLAMISISPAGNPIELEAAEWAILKAIERKLEERRAVGDMHGWRKLLGEYEGRASEFLRRDKKSRLGAP